MCSSDLSHFLPAVYLTVHPFKLSMQPPIRSRHVSRKHLQVKLRLRLFVLICAGWLMVVGLASPRSIAVPAKTLQMLERTSQLALTPPIPTPPLTPPTGRLDQSASKSWDNMPLSTRGAEILDQNGRTVVLRGVNWFGLETDIHAPHRSEERRVGKEC